MENNFYEELKSDFSSVCDVCKDLQIDKNKLDAVCGRLVFSKRQLNKKGSRKEKQILIYCIDTLLSLVEKHKYEIVCDFSRISADIPDIFLGERNIYSFRKEIDIFREKYGKEYFEGFFKISLFLNSKVPKNAFEYFLPDWDEDFQQEHPVLYYVIVFLAVLGMMTPFAIYSAVMIHEFGSSAPVNFWWLIGFIGCLIIGIGIFNIFGALLNQYLGHWFTALTFIVGGVIVTISCLLYFNDGFSQVIAQEIHDFWLLISLAIIFPLFNFVMFRSSAKSWMKRTCLVGEKRFDKLRSGFLGFWFYTNIHKEVGIGAVYYLNAAYVLLLFVTSMISILFGWVKIITPIIFVFYCALFIVSTVAYIFATIQDNISDYGRCFVFWDIDKYSKKPKSSFLDILFPIVYILLIYAFLKKLSEIWDFAIPFLFI